MTTYKMTEKQNINSTRESETFEAKSLTSAKRKASAKQCFFGTIIELEAHGGTVAVKEKNGKWSDAK